jgi:hypothetical protein
MRPNSQLPNASPPIKAVSTALTAYTLTPKSKLSSRTQVTS